jgi:cell division protein ZapA (FtsZ GTPase activity inhibitor)
MKIHSRSLISELKSFVASGGSYAAKIGDTDDLVMASLLVVRMLQQLQDFHQDLGNHMRDHEEFVQPLPFFAVLS